MNYFKKLLKSKTIQGIVMAAAGAAVNYAKGLLTPEILAQYGGLISVVTALAQAGGLSFATYGRLVAAGPLTPPSPQGGEGNGFDGTGGELPQ